MTYCSFNRNANTIAVTYDSSFTLKIMLSSVTVSSINIGLKIYEFYNAPITKFWQTVIFHMIFLICFTYMVLVKTPPKPSSVEVFVWIYTFTFGCDKIREVIKAFHC